jgi:hypothetical protein
MTAGLALIALLTFGLIGIFGPVIAGVYLAARLNGRR